MEEVCKAATHKPQIIPMGPSSNTGNLYKVQALVALQGSPCCSVALTRA